MIAKEKNYFKDYGLNAEFIPIDSSKYGRIAISSGQLDIVSGGATNYFDPISKGIDLKVIAPFTADLYTIYVRPGDINTFSDLNNKRLGARIDSGDSFILRKIFEENNLDLNISYVDIDPNYRPLALMEKNIIDAASAKEIDKQTFNDIGAVLIPEFVNLGYDERRFVVSSIIVRGDYLREHPQNVDIFIDVYIKSQRYIKEHPEETSKILLAELNKNAMGAKIYTDKDVSYLISNNNILLWSDPIFLEEYVRSAYKVGIIDKNLTLDDIYDNRYEEKLKKAQEEIYGQKN